MQSAEVAEDPQYTDFCAWLWNWRWGEGSCAEQLWRVHTANFNPIAASPWNKRKWILSVLNTCCPFSLVSGGGDGDTPNQESRKLLLQIFASANQSCSSSFFFHSARKVAKNKLMLVFGTAAKHPSSSASSIRNLFLFSDYCTWANQHKMCARMKACILTYS